MENETQVITGYHRPLVSIDDVIGRLDEIILESEQNEDAQGYFAVLYRRVTWRVKEEIGLGYFDDAARMEKLDVIFAKRYLDAYEDYKNHKPVSQSWFKAFELAKESWPITMQHLLMGMNAHINLDLGIAAAEICRDTHTQALENDFYKINEILASLVNEVQHNLSTIWPPLKWILLKTGQYDNLVVDFSMQIARDGAWRFTQTLAATREEEIKECIKTRDEAVARKTSLITSDRLMLRILLGIVRLGETGKVSDKIRKLKYSEVE